MTTVKNNRKTAAGGQSAVIKSWIAELKKDDGFAREKARLSLVKIGRPALGALIEALSSKQMRVRWEAATALQQMADPAAAPALVKALQDKEFDVRWLAAEALIVLGRRGAAALLEAVISHSDQTTLREGAHHVLNHLAMGDTDEHHMMDHPISLDASLRNMLRPVVQALADVDASMKAPLAARAALDALKARE